MRALGGSLLLSLLAAAPAAAQSSQPAAKPELFAPKRIVLGWMKEVSLSVASLPGVGAPHAATNVGRVLSVEQKVAAVKVRIELPRRRSPQQLVLLLFRDRGPVFSYRLPLQGRTRLRIRTRPFSTVYLRYGALEVVKKMGGRSRRYLRLAVPPGIKKVDVEVVDKAGLKTSRTIRVSRPAYPRLALAVQPRQNSSSRPEFHVTAVVAEPEDEKVELEVLGPEDGQRQPVKARKVAEGRFSASFTPREKGSLRLRGTLPAEGASPDVELTARYVPPAPAPHPTTALPTLVKRKPSASPARPARRLAFELSVAAGILHNTGDFFSPQISVAVGATYALGEAGSLGLRVGSSVAWKSQSIGSSVGGATDLEVAESRTILAPLFVGPIYRGPRWPVVPYASANFVVQFAHTRNTASYTQERATLDVAPGFLAQLGGELPLGPTFLFLQAGFLYSQVDSDDVELLAGGLSVEGGLRLAF